MKEKLARFLGSVANLTQTQQLTWATATGRMNLDSPPVEPVDIAAVSVPATNSGSAAPQPAVPIGLTNYPPPEKWDDTALERLGQPVERSYEANPGEVWEETEFWIELSWRIDPDGSLGIRQYFESPYRPGAKITAQEYYRWMFENSVPGLPEAATKEGLSPYEYMSKYGAFEIRQGTEKPYAQPVAADLLQNTVTDPDSGMVYTQAPAKPSANITPLPAFPADERGRPIGLQVNGQVVRGFNTSSRCLEFYSTTLRDWGWPGS